MDPSKIIYWGLVAFLVLTFGLGIWGAFFADSFLEARAKMAESRLGKKAVYFFQSALRILSLILAVLSLYLLFKLCSIMPCALR